MVSIFIVNFIIYLLRKRHATRLSSSTVVARVKPMRFKSKIGACILQTHVTHVYIHIDNTRTTVDNL